MWPVRSLSLKGSLLLSKMLLLAWCALPVAAQQQQAGAVQGRVTDQLGAIVIGAEVKLLDAKGQEHTTNTSNDGTFAFRALPAGKYRARVSATGFGVGESELEVPDGGVAQLNITLSVILREEKVTVESDKGIGIEPENNGDAITLKGNDLQALPDDPDDLAAALQALAGPSAGPDGGEVLVDGFAVRRLPPKNTIREIRINQNPFSAENDRLGSRSIEVFTKPGTEQLHGEVFFNFNDESLNSRNPFSANRPPFQLRYYGGSLSGPVVKNKASFFLDAERRETDDNAVINAQVVNDAFQIVPLNLGVLTPQRLTTLSPRLEYQLNSSNTLIARYNYAATSMKRAGVGEFSLLSHAFDISTREHTVQLSETAVIKQKIVNETRFQFSRRTTEQVSDSPAATILVLDAFTGGGAQTGRSSSLENRWELTNNTTWKWRQHSLKAGGRLRFLSLDDISMQNFGGTYTFAPGFGPLLDAGNRVVTDASGNPVTIPLTSIERYRRTLLFRQLGRTPAEIQALGGGASQFSIAAGNSRTGVSQTDAGLFIQDDWRITREFILSPGLRYEWQNNISGNLNLAPRIRFAWSPGPGGGQRPKTVIRGGAGIFYDRVGESLVLQSRRFDGSHQQQFVVTDPSVLSSFPDVPSIETLNNFALKPTLWRLADDLTAPYTIQSALGIDRQLPHNYSLSVTFLNLRTLHALRARNVNAPLHGTFTPGQPGTGIRPFPGLGNIYQYESSGRLNQHLLVVLLNNRLSKRLTIFARYTLGKAEGDTDGAQTFPADSYDLSTEYGRTAADIRHRFLFGGSFRTWGGIRLNPFVIATSGRPYNIITGRDTNLDTIYAERPAFATDPTKPGLVSTPYGLLDPNPEPGQPLIPRNLGTGPAFLGVNLRLSKTFNVDRWLGGHAVLPASSGEENGRRRLTLSIQALNILNHVNGGLPVGNLGSPFFGRSISSAGNFGINDAGSAAAGNRRIAAQLVFSF